MYLNFADKPNIRNFLHSKVQVYSLLLMIRWLHVILNYEKHTSKYVNISCILEEEWYTLISCILMHKEDEPVQNELCIYI